MADISKIKLPNGTTYDIDATTVNGHTVDKNVPSNAVFTDTNTKVTSVGNHYAPTEDSSATLSTDASSTTAATWNSTSLVTGVDIKRDAKGHVTGVAVDSIKMPINPNTDTHRPIKVNGSQILGNNTAPFNLIAGDNVRMAITGSGSVTIHADQIDDSYTYSQYQDLPSATKMQDKIFMVKDAPNPSPIPIVDEYAREQIVDVKSNLTDLLNLSKPLETISYTASVYHCTGTITNIPTIQRVVGTNYFTIDGRLAITSFKRSGGNPGITITLPSDIIPTESQVFTVGVRSEYPRELFTLKINSNSNILSLATSEAFANATNGTLTAVIPRIIFYIKF